MSSGLFLAAIAGLGERNSERKTVANIEEEAILAEALLLTGKGTRAVKLAKKLQHSHLRTPRIESRCLAVLALSAFEKGRVGESLRTLQRAHRMALASHDQELACRIRLELMANLSDASGPAAVAAVLGECERDLASLQSPDLQARFHITVAQIEGKRGLLEQAELHLRAARTVLSSSPNVWLSGLLYLNSSTVHALRMEFAEGVRNAEMAVECAQASGHLRTRLGAIGNIAYLSLWQNDLLTARQRCIQGLQMSDDFSDVRVALLETMAQVTLAERSASGCRGYLAEIERVTSKDKRFQLSWYALAALTTRARLHQLESSWTECLEECESGITLAPEQSDPGNQISLRVLAADALLELGRNEEAATHIQAAADLDSDVPAAIFAEVERARAALLARSVGREAARRPFERALRVLSAVGGIAPRMDAALSYLRTMQPCEKVRRALEAEPWNLGPVVEPTLPAKATNNRVKPAKVEGVTQPIDLTDAVALERLVWRSDLLAQEAFVLLRESGYATATAIIERSNAKSVRVVAHEGWSAAEAKRATVKSNNVMSIALGKQHERAFELLVQPRHGILAHGFLRDLQFSLQKSLALRSLQKAERAQQSLMSTETVPGGDEGVFVSAQMRKLKASAKQMAKSTSSILILGETGTGKEVLARCIHANSHRSEHDLIAYNCTGVPKDMVESQLFGHRRGAFTGAQDDSLGVIRAANHGTLLLDEIGELDIDTQPKLLRFLQNGEIQPLGEPRPIKVDVRVIAATNADLDERIRDGRFREDLLYRLNIFTLHIPPLRSRREEILPFVQHFLHVYSREHGRTNIRITEDAQKCLLLFDWPGNVRQLGSEINRVVAMADDDSIVGVEHLSPQIIEAGQTLATPAPSDRAPERTEVTIQTDQPLNDAVGELEEAMIRHSLEVHGGHVGMTAQALGLSRKGLYLKRQRLGLGNHP